VFGGAQAIHAALGRFKKAGRGVLVYLRDGASGVPTTAIAEDTTPSELERSREWREVGLGAQILRDLRISSIQLHATRSRTYVGLAGFGIEIESTEPLDEVSSHRLTIRETRQPRRLDEC
jgi:3,4-dihydroxy 2-butanone 4-phosphate synthase/GTP cyclohydrolase II